MCSGRIGLLALTIASLNGCRGASTAARPFECPPGLSMRYGACVAPSVAAAICGPRRVSTPASCLAKPSCEEGRALDLTTGECLAHRETRGIASSVGVLVDESTVLSCENGGTLASGVSGEATPLGCLPPPPPDSPPIAPIAGKNGLIDVVAWSSAVFAEGGAASPLCRAVAESPAALVVAATVDVPIQIELTFPDNDVTQVVAAVRPAELDRTIAPFVEALRALGGTANQAFLGLTATCRRSSERPRTISPKNP